MNYDPRTTPARRDLAAQHLEGRVAATRFVAGTELEVRDAQAPVRREPSPEAPLDTEVLHGERVTVYDDNGEGWCWGQLGADGYVGWIPTNALGPPGPAPTHRVAALRTLVFPVRNIKAPPVEALPFGSRVTVSATRPADSDLTNLASGFCIPTRHLAPLGSTEPDFVAVAERFLGVPYLWGGKTTLGIDCSGLVQTALTASGLRCPRDSDMQERAVGASLPIDDPAAWRRGDLIFWEGHVAIVRDDASIVHANAFHMAVAIEPTREALRRIADAGTPLISVKRPT
ncbi:MAG: C40 family peptidase [Bradyrhizobiaceae bacterium]|nr:C40 family peptidase [Bradyrhizobiaceae bacterium]